MAVFALIENTTVTNIIVADAWQGGVDITNLTPRPGVGWTYDGQGFTAPVEAPPEPVVLNDIQRADLLARMTPTELHGWRRAAQRALSTDSPVTADRNALYAWLRWESMNGTVNLSSADIQGLGAVWVALGMTQARATELLTPLTT